MKEVLIHPFSQKVEGEICAPRDKSLSHRAAMIGALSQGTTVIDGFLFVLIVFLLFQVLSYGEWK